MKRMILTVLVLCFSFSSWALDLGAAKEQGLVGEQSDGYLGLVVNTPEAAQLIKTVNNQRKAKYQEIAEKRGTKLDAVERFAGTKLTEKAAAEKQFYQNENGKWTR